MVPLETKVIFQAPIFHWSLNHDYGRKGIEDDFPDQRWDIHWFPVGSIDSGIMKSPLKLGKIGNLIHPLKTNRIQQPRFNNQTNRIQQPKVDVAPPLKNMEPKNWCFVDVSPFPRRDFQVPAVGFQGWSQPGFADAFASMLKRALDFWSVRDLNGLLHQWLLLVDLQQPGSL